MRNIGLKRVVTIISLSLALMTTSCQSDNKEVDSAPTKELESFMSSEIIGAVASTKEYALDPKNEQIVSTSNQKLYSVTNCDYTRYYTLKIDGDLELNKSVSVECSLESYAGFEAGNYSMKVVKVDDQNNKVWIWCEKSDLGFILKFY